MQLSDRKTIPYQLFGALTQSSPLSALPKDASLPSDQQAAGALTNAYITSLYYSALSNLYLQSILPDDIALVDAEMPRVKIALARTYADFTAAAAWLSQVDMATITASPAKSYYDEVHELESDAVKDLEAIYSEK
jgi:hypothetical protein